MGVRPDNQLVAAGVVPAVQAPLVADAGRVVAELREAVLDEVPAFTDSGNPDVIPELGQHLEAHVREGGCPFPESFVL